MLIYMTEGYWRFRPLIRNLKVCVPSVGRIKELREILVYRQDELPTELLRIILKAAITARARRKHGGETLFLLEEIERLAHWGVEYRQMRNRIWRTM